MKKVELRYRECDDEPSLVRIRRVLGEDLKDALLKLTEELYLCEIDEDDVETAQDILDGIKDAQENYYDCLDGEGDIVYTIKDGDTGEILLNCAEELEDEENEW